jgi:methylated-DNA-[protein]-cysteine S-methyltransferase
MTSSSVLVPSPVGPLRLVGDGDALTGVEFTEALVTERGSTTDDALLDETRHQLAAYFGGRRKDFELALEPAGTEFQLRVWEQLRRIPFGMTVSYGDIAASLGLPPGASRAVGLANGANPIAIIVPCHRVIGSDGTLVGYGGGLDRKRYLLGLEAPSVQGSLFEG